MKRREKRKAKKAMKKKDGQLLQQAENILKQPVEFAQKSESENGYSDYYFATYILNYANVLIKKIQFSLESKEEPSANGIRKNVGDLKVMLEWAEKNLNRFHTTTNEDMEKNLQSLKDILRELEPLIVT